MIKNIRNKLVILIQKMITKKFFFALHLFIIAHSIPFNNSEVHHKKVQIFTKYCFINEPVFFFYYLLFLFLFYFFKYKSSK